MQNLKIQKVSAVPKGREEYRKMPECRVGTMCRKGSHSPGMKKMGEGHGLGGAEIKSYILDTLF